MKKTTIFSMIFLMMVTPIFTDENLKLENISFRFMFFDKLEKADTGFINLNPLFFNTNNYLSLKLFDNNIEINRKLSEINTKQYVENNDHNNDWIGFFLGIAAYSIISIDYYNNPQYYKHLGDIWDRNKEEEKLYQRIRK